MTTKLKKGQEVNLKQENPNLRKVIVGLGWEPICNRPFWNNEPDIDVDAAVICMTEGNHYESVVYFGRLIHSSGAIWHKGDSIAGGFDDDNEQIIIDLDRVPMEITRLSVTINIYKAFSRNQTFGKVNNCHIHIFDFDTETELVQYRIDGNFNSSTGIFVADIYRKNGEWNIKAIGEGVKVFKIEDMVRMKCKERKEKTSFSPIWY